MHARKDSRPYFRRNVELDPLFAAEGADLEEAERSLAHIEQLTKKLETLFAQGALSRKLFFAKDPIGVSVVPLPLIRAVIVAERARRAHRREPSAESRDALLRSWRDAAAAYVESAKRYERMHTLLYALDPAGAAYKLQDLFGNVSSASFVKAFLRQLKENGAHLARDVESFGTTPRSRPIASHIQIQPCAFPQQYRRLHELEIKEGITPFRWSRIEASYGPFACDLVHIDGRPVSHACMLYFLRDDAAALSSMWVAVLDTFLFTRVWRESTLKGDSGEKVPFVFSGGISCEDSPYWYEASGHLYVTRDPSYWMDIATYADVARRPELDASSVSAQKSSLLERMLGACADDMRGYVRHTERRVRQGQMDSYSLLYGLLMRSHPALYFLTFNKSVWRLSDAPRLLGDGRSENGESPYLSQAEVLSSLSDEDMRKVMGAQTLREKRERALGFVQ